MDKVNTYASNINHLVTGDFFKALKKDQYPTQKEFIHSHYGFLKAVECWSELLIQMLSRATTSKERAVFIENLYDEHGNGNLDNSHVNTFIMLIKLLDHTENLSLINCTQSNSYKFAVSAFINKLKSALNTKSFQFCCGMLGIIEYIYIDASGEIHNYLTKFLPPDQINHYSLHEILDKKHVDDLFSLIDTNDMSEGENGMLYGYDAMWNMYQSMSILLPMNNSA